MQLDYVVVTSVDRDDLEDQGSSHFARTVSTIKKLQPDLIVEILTPDFRGNKELIELLADSEPDVFAQNIETVRRLTPSVRDPRAGYDQTLSVLKIVKDYKPNMYTKSSLMLGLGETDEEIIETLKDLRRVHCDVITFGQYLQPTERHLKVIEYITPEKFEHWKKVADDLGFLYVASGPLVRSSYRAGEFFLEGVIRKQKENIFENQNLKEKSI